MSMKIITIAELKKIINESNRREKFSFWFTEHFNEIEKLFREEFSDVNPNAIRISKLTPWVLSFNIYVEKNDPNINSIFKRLKKFRESMLNHKGISKYLDIEKNNRLSYKGVTINKKRQTIMPEISDELVFPISLLLFSKSKYV